MDDRTLYVIARVHTGFDAAHESVREGIEARDDLAQRLAASVRGVVPEAGVQVQIYRGSICAVLMVSIGTGLATSALYDAIKAAVRVTIWSWIATWFGDQVR